MTNLVRHENDRFRHYSLEELFMGPGTGATVPNVGDQVTDRKVGIYFVSSIDPDPQNPVPSLELVQRFNNSSSFNADSESLITAFSMYDPSAATVVFVDDTVNPITATIDERWRSFVGASHGILFLGTDTSADKGVVISARYNDTGNFVSNSIPYETIDERAPNVRRPKTFNLTRPVTGQTIVTLVDYNAAGDVVGKRPFLVELSSFIRPSNDSDIQLTGFRLNSVLIDPENTQRILNPINTPLDTSTFSVTLDYSDGSTVENLPIDGSKIIMHGINNFNSSQLGLPVNINVSYYPSEDEPYISPNGGDRAHITNSYSLANVVDNTSFALKLFVIPEFVSTISGYKLRWYLLNLERDIFAEVTDMTTVMLSNFNNSAFNGKRYGEVQTLDASIVMDDILPGLYPGHIHSQRINLVLEVPGTVTSSPWTIDYILTGSYILGNGEVASCSNTGNGIVNITNGYTSFNEWLFELYNLSAPLYDSKIEDTEPDPTHFIVSYEGVEKEVAIADWDENIVMPEGTPVMEPNKTLHITWLTKTVDGDLYHATTGLLTVIDL